MSLTDIRAQLVVVEKATPAVKSAYAYPPDAAIGPLPAFINIMDSGEVTTPRMMGWRETVHILKAKVLIQYASDLASAERKIETMVYDFVNTLDHYKTLTDTLFVVDADVLRYEAGTITLPNQEQPFIGISFDIQVREIETGGALRYAAAG
jgi:hypothetical protein